MLMLTYCCLHVSSKLHYSYARYSWLSLGVMLYSLAILSNISLVPLILVIALFFLVPREDKFSASRSLVFHGVLLISFSLLFYLFKSNTHFLTHKFHKVNLLRRSIENGREFLLPFL